MENCADPKHHLIKVAIHFASGSVRKPATDAKLS